ncbi:MAG: hypothetical protein OCD02_13735 [Spirochaetaceae bacterium]
MYKIDYLESEILRFDLYWFAVTEAFEAVLSKYFYELIINEKSPR